MKKFHVEISLGSMTRLGYNWAVIDMITLTLLLGSFGVNPNFRTVPYRHPMKDTCIPPGKKNREKSALPWMLILS